MKKIVLAAALSALSAASFAAPESFTIDPTHTAQTFSYNHMGFSTQTHGFDRSSGKITIDRTAKTGSVNVVIDAKSVDGGSALFTGHLQGEEFFNAEKFPEITFKSTTVKFEGDKPVSVDGNLTVKGITKPVTLKLTHFVLQPNGMVKRDAIGASASAVIKRSEFGMAQYVPYVSDELTLNIVVEAIKD
jgi:polyisoprenoid-binding protein YceI